MNPDDFEQYLARQPLRQVPTEWREEILVAARVEILQTAKENVSARKVSHRLVFEDIGIELLPKSGWRDWFWPSPVTCATFASVWLAICVGLVIVITHLTASETPVVAASKTASPAPQILLMAVVEKHQLIENLMDIVPERVGPHSTTTAGPHSQRRSNFSVT